MEGIYTTLNNFFVNPLVHLLIVQTVITYSMHLYPLTLHKATYLLMYILPKLGIILHQFEPTIIFTFWELPNCVELYYLLLLEVTLVTCFTGPHFY